MYQPGCGFWLSSVTWAVPARRGWFCLLAYLCVVSALPSPRLVANPATPCYHNNHSLLPVPLRGSSFYLIKIYYFQLGLSEFQLPVFTTPGSRGVFYVLILALLPAANFDTGYTRIEHQAQTAPQEDPESTQQRPTRVTRRPEDQLRIGHVDFGLVCAS